MLLLVAGCLGERDRPGPPRLAFTIDDTTLSASRTDTIAGNVSATDPDGIDSVWVSVDSEVRGDDGGFNDSFIENYRFVLPAGGTPGTKVNMSFRARDVAGFQVQRDTYVVVIP